MKKIVLAIDSFKGCLTSAEAGHAFALALQDEGIDALPLCVSDGGEGMLDAFCRERPHKGVVCVSPDP